MRRFHFSRVVRASEDIGRRRVGEESLPVPEYSLTMEALDAHGTTGSYFAKVMVVSRNNFRLEVFRQLHADKGDGSQASLWHAVGVQDPMVKEATASAVKIIQQRSNSLMPYELQEIVSAKGKVVNALNIFYLLLKIKWENEVQIYKAEMKRTLEGKWTMNQMQLDAGH